ncbi:hemolysin family protein [Jeotgalibaca sp. MA1X17-3]|uniref:HlyC/CorC family transporter n=1 Tax=Jeotgalibaca sp. MA1X17-3 TaxID=2908211 RepID=UPI001F15A84C|nr:hemolysin family protein [Jeotgalibaca sp. MA1X17-3]UJF15621.1 hemolysin family protein [Jeotgalibaca sp. MA1X17-3]
MDSDSSSSIMTIVILVVLLLLSGYFSSSETAFTSANRIRLRNDAKKGDKRAERTLSLTEDYNNVLSTILVGNNIVNIASSSLSTILFISYFPQYGVTISTIVMTILVLVFGEITPKAIAKDRPERVAKFATPVLSVLMRILKPLNWIFAKWNNMLAKRLQSEDKRISEEELLSIVDEAENGGSLEDDEHQLIRSAIEFHDLEVDSILTPRVDVVAADLHDTDEEIQETFDEHGYSRILLYDDSIDEVRGVLHERDFNRYMRRKAKGEAELSPTESMKEVIYIPAMMKLSRLLKIMQQSKAHMAVVSDEYGGTIGIVTMEDVLEELVGEIWDETDDIEEEIILLKEGKYQVRGEASLEKVFDLFELQGEEIFVSNTISGFVSEMLGRFPKETDQVTYGNMLVHVIKVKDTRILEITVEKNQLEFTG